MSEAEAKIIAKAKDNADKPERIRFQIITMLIAEARSFGYEIEAEIFDAAGYESTNEYWRVAMSEPMTAPKFVNLLVRHRINPRSGKETYWLRQRIAEVLKIAREAREPWLTVNGDITWIKDDEEGTGWQVPEGLMVRDPKEAAKWMLSLLKHQPLIPPGLRDFVEGKPPTEPIYSTGAAGRPTSMHLIKAEMHRRADHGELQPTLKAEFESLVEWLSKKHPQAHPATSKTIRNNLRNFYNELKSPK